MQLPRDILIKRSVLTIQTKGIVKIYAIGIKKFFGLNEEGTVFYNNKKYSSLKDWVGICQIVFGEETVAGLTTEGKVKFYYDHEYYADEAPKFRRKKLDEILDIQDKLAHWQNIACLYAAHGDSFWGITNDGEIMTTDTVLYASDYGKLNWGKLFDDAKEYADKRIQIELDHKKHMQEHMQEHVRIKQQIAQRETELLDALSEWQLKKEAQKEKTDSLSKKIEEKKESLPLYQGIFKKKQRKAIEDEIAALSRQLKEEKEELKKVEDSNPLENDQKLKSLYTQLQQPPEFKRP